MNIDPKERDKENAASIKKKERELEDKLDELFENAVKAGRTYRPMPVVPNRD